MKKQAVNTFTKGLSMDFSPLLTPNNVLTNNLNGTLLTFNGNEYILQNDQGNGTVGTATLPAGYVPVGIKEHGGIIYVASHNPITNKSQIGSFPSPKQLYFGENSNITEVNLNFSNLIALSVDGIPIIKYENYKEKLFQEVNSTTYKTFHPGDKFIISTPSISSYIKQAIADGVLTLQLGVITSSGNIEYIENSKLRTYNNGLWIYETDSDVASTLKDSTKVQVFSNKSSGWLVMIVQLHIIDTFNLTRTYQQNDDTISVNFLGIIKSSLEKYSGKTSSNSYLQLYSPDQISTSPHTESTITISGNTSDNTIHNYEIYPACPYGVIRSMKKSGSLKFSDIRPNSQNFSEWRYFVNTVNNYLKISWGYDYYNMSEDSAISSMKFLFFDLSNTQSGFMSATTDSAEADAERTADYVYNVTREYFNGNFEEIIPFTESTIDKNKIYVVVLRKCIKSKWSNVTFRFVYTSSYFNSYFDGTNDFSTLSCNELITVTPKLTNKISKKSTEYSNKLADDAKYSDYTNVVNSSMFSKQVAENTDVTSYTYSSKVKRTYDIISTVLLENDFDSNKFVGKLRPDDLKSKFTTLNASIDNTAFTYNNLITSSDDSLSDIIKDISRITSTGEIVFKDLVGTGTFSTTREIYAECGGVNQQTTYMEKLIPLYSPSMSPSEFNALYNYRKDGNTLYCCGGEQAAILYNTKVTANNPRSEGDGMKGTDAGSGSEDIGLQAAMSNMGSGYVGILAGCQNDAASLKMYGTQRIYSGTTSDIWECSNNEVDGADNYLITVWLDEYGKYNCVNFTSRKTDSLDPNSNSSSFAIIRLDRMLNCILSQILTVQNKQGTAYFVGPSSSAYVYHLPFDTECTFKINNANGGILSNYDVYYNDKTIKSLVSTWQNICGTANLVDYLPKFDVNIPNTVDAIIDFGKDIKLDDNKVNLVNFYTSAYSTTNIKSILPSSILSINNFRQNLYVADPAYCTGHNSDGSLIFTPDTYGNTLPWIENGAIVDTKLALWDSTSTTQKIAPVASLNFMFTSQYKSSGMSGAITDPNFFNGMLISSTFSPKDGDINWSRHKASSLWTSGKDNGGPNFTFSITFWTDVISSNIYRHIYKTIYS